MDLAIGRLKQAAAYRTSVEAERDASLARKAQLDDREKKVQALEARAKVMRRAVKRSKKADAARKHGERRRGAASGPSPSSKSASAARARDAAERQTAARAAAKSLQNREARLVRWETSLLAAEQQNLLASEAAAAREAKAKRSSAPPPPPGDAHRARTAAAPESSEPSKYRGGPGARARQSRRRGARLRPGRRRSPPRGAGRRAPVRTARGTGLRAAAAERAPQEGEEEEGGRRARACCRGSGSVDARAARADAAQT